MHSKRGLQHLSFLWISFISLCLASPVSCQVIRRFITKDDIKVGAERTSSYLPLLENKNVGVVANHTSFVGQTHLIDTLLHLNVKLVKIFVPEHGFRGQVEAGEQITDSKDKQTGLTIVSLYGDKLKPTPEDMSGIDVIVFDIQDVGTRFYTYATTMQYMMEACATRKIPFVLLDRPNPNGHYIDGPVLEKKYASVVGLNPVPLVHGLSLGEYAEMINGEGWLEKGMKCDLKVIPVYNYNHSYYYAPPIPPSPNLPNAAAINLYPSLGLFEGTVISVGRGTPKPFQVIGHPDLKNTTFTFYPVSMAGYSINPPYKNQTCYGYDLSEFGETYIRDAGKIYLFWLLELYKQFTDKKHFFNSYFDKLAGNGLLRKQIKEGRTEEEIRKSWEKDLMNYKRIRKKYLLYPDFE